MDSQHRCVSGSVHARNVRVQCQRFQGAASASCCDLCDGCTCTVTMLGKEYVRDDIVLRVTLNYATLRSVRQIVHFALVKIGHLLYCGQQAFWPD